MKNPHYNPRGWKQAQKYIERGVVIDGTDYRTVMKETFVIFLVGSLMFTPGILKILLTN